MLRAAAVVERAEVGEVKFAGAGRLYGRERRRRRGAELERVRILAGAAKEAAAERVVLAHLSLVRVGVEDELALRVETPGAICAPGDELAIC